MTNEFEEILQQISEKEILKVGCCKHVPQFVVEMITYCYDSIDRKKNQERVETIVTKCHSNKKM